MLKQAALSILALASLTKLAGQSYFTTLSSNNLSATVNANGILFNRGLEAPKGSGTKSISISQFWIGGKNNGNLHIAARLNDSLKNDFWPGPIDTVNGNAGDSAFWNKIYKVTAAEIAAHKTDFNKNGYIMPDGIKHWPGSNPTQQPFKQVLAKFVDYNANRIYEPEMGEYPFIKGDEAAYFIVNDKANTHFASGGMPMGVEVQGLAYVYANNPVLANTVFLELTFINRSTNNYDSVFAGVWTDFELGAKGDEYISSLPSKNAFFGYNSDTSDALYGTYPPVQGVLFLNRPLQYTIEIDADGGVANRGLPQSPQEFYNYLHRKWRNNIQLTEGANGFMSSATPADFIYNGDPCNQGNPGWTEVGSAQAPGKRSMMGSIGPVQLPSNGFLRLELAYVWERGTNGPLESICKLNNTLDAVKAYYNKFISSVDVAQPLQFGVYPNPAADYVEVKLPENVDLPAIAQVFDMQGKLLHTGTVNETNQVINTQQLPAGMYTLQLTTQNQSGYSKLMIAR